MSEKGWVRTPVDRGGGNYKRQAGAWRTLPSRQRELCRHSASPCYGSV
ncbi:MAG: hypothetical protein IJL38_00425 [Bacteroidales bacterium]|nr:hypothetical protein [Bacteroidales bacterium]